MIERSIANAIIAEVQPKRVERRRGGALSVEYRAAYGAPIPPSG